MFEKAILPDERALGFIPPLLPTLVDEPPTGDEWLHEIKHDGYRTQLVLDGARARAFTRNGHDWSRQYAPVLAAASDLRCASVIIDGEMVVQDEHGRSDFHALRGAIGRDPHRLIFYAFDLLHLGGTDLRPRVLIERRTRLHGLIGEHDPAWPIQFSQHHAGSGADMLRAVCGMELEGIVSKKASSRYRSGRSLAWLKTKCLAESELVVIGAQHEPGKPAFALLAREVEAGLEYAGSAFVTLRGDERDRFWTKIEQLSRPRPPIRLPGHKRARWIAPEMRVSVQHLKGGDKLRNATIREVLP